MSAWLGVPGNMVELKCPASAAYQQAPDMSVETTLGGRDKAQVGRTIAREWSLDVGPAHQGAATALGRFHHGLYGTGPWWFVDPWAAVTNVLTPAQSMPGPRNGGPWNAVPVGTWSVPGVGVVSHSVLTSGTSDFEQAPVLPGSPVSAGAYVAGAGRGRVIVQVLDKTGSVIATATTYIDLTSTPVWSEVTLPAVPAAGQTARLAVSDAVQQVALVAVNWTTSIREWAPGQGCSRAVVGDTTVDPVTAVNNVAALASHSTKIIELRG